MEGLPWIIREGPQCHHRYLCKRGKGRSDTHRAGGDAKVEAETGAGRPGVEECQQVPEAEKGKKQILSESLQNTVALLIP